MREVVVTIYANPHPKPRETQRDRWRPRPCVQAHRTWRDLVRWAYRAQAKMAHFDECEMSCHFYVAGQPNLDIKNLIAGVEDALRGVAYPDDKAKHLRGYYGDPRVHFLCETCPDHPCGAVRSCTKGRAEIKIREVAK